MKVVQIFRADVYRDGGSLGFQFEGDNGNRYEFFLKTRRFEKGADANYHPPVLFLENCNSGEIVRRMTSWEEAQEFIRPLAFDNDRFRQIQEVVNNRGNFI